MTTAPSQSSAATPPKPTMPPLHAPIGTPLTLIVAATPKMGIGRNGQLPWPALKSEMAYFARVTRRAPAGAVNAVLMGRRTWDSIPPRFRPLRGRLNVVLTRRPEESLGLGLGKEKGVEGPLIARGLVEAMRALQERLDGDGQGAKMEGMGKVFVIGGAEVYKRALEMNEARRVLLTRVKTEFECDTFFPVDLREGEEQTGGQRSGWRKCSKAELDDFTGEQVPAGLQRDEGVEWEFEMWEREEREQEQEIDYNYDF